MTQQINLYGAQFHPGRDPLPAPRLLGIAAAALLVLAGLWGWNAHRLGEARARAEVARAALAAAQAGLPELARSAGVRRADPALAEALSRAEALEQSRTQLLGLLEAGALGAPGGFSETMRALARQSVGGLWLTGFDLSATQVELRGRALSAELVPAYLRRLGTERALDGVALNALRIGQPAGVTPPPAAAGGEPAPAPVFVEFVAGSDPGSLVAQQQVQR